MPFIERKDGAIIAIYGVKQPGQAEEFLPDDDPEVVAFVEVMRNPPKVDALTPPQFHAMVDILGLTDTMLQTILAMPQPQRGVAYAKVYYSQSYRRDHPLFSTMAPMLGVTQEQLDAAWEQAKQIEP